LGVGGDHTEKRLNKREYVHLQRLGGEEKPQPHRKRNKNQTYLWRE